MVKIHQIPTSGGGGVIFARFPDGQTGAMPGHGNTSELKHDDKNAVSEPKINRFPIFLQNKKMYLQINPLEKHF